MNISYRIFTALVLAMALPIPAHAQPVPPETAAPEPPPVPETSEPAPAPEPPPVPETPAPVMVEPAATAEPAAAPGALEVKYDRGLSIETTDGMYALDIAFRTQLRAELVRTEAAGELQSRFLIPRLRIPIEGHALGRDNRFKVEFDFGGLGNPGLRDYYVDHLFSDALRLRVGQWKRPFNRQELSSDFAGEFNERSITNGFVGGGRDLGVALHNGYDKSPQGIEWALGVFNGTGDRSRQSLDCTDVTDITTCTPSQPSNVPADLGPMAVVRVGWNQGDIKGYSEGDFEGGPLRFAVAAGYKVDLRDLAEDAAGDLQLQHAATADFIAKIQGYAVSGAAMLIKQGSADPLLGFYGQASAFVLPRQIQVAARFSFFQANTATDRIEALGAINWFFAGHALKWMTDAGILQTMPDDDATDDVTDFQARTQLQFTF
jgi:phosphate-selective porin OprO/OprP